MPGSVPDLAQPGPSPWRGARGACPQMAGAPRQGGRVRLGCLAMSSWPGKWETSNAAARIGEGDELPDCSTRLGREELA